MNNFFRETKGYINDKLSDLKEDMKTYTGKTIAKALLISLPVLGGCYYGSQVVQTPMGVRNNECDGAFSYLTDVTLSSGKEFEVIERAEFWESNDLFMNYLEFKFDTTINGQLIAGYKLFIEDERTKSVINDYRSSYYGGGKNIYADVVLVVPTQLVKDNKAPDTTVFFMEDLSDDFPDLAIRAEQQHGQGREFMKMLVHKDYEEDLGIRNQIKKYPSQVTSIDY